MEPMVLVALMLALLAGALYAHAWAAGGSARVQAPADALAGEVGELRAEMRRLVDRVVSDSSGLAARLEGIDSRMTQTQTVSTDLAQNIFATLGDVKAATTSVADQAREFTALQDLLRAPKARGGIGEAMLEELLRQVLPPQAYATQHRFKSGTIVDAVVKASGRLVCIDSKFPLANYRRMCEAPNDVEKVDAERAFAADIDRHIKDISSRYIVPDEDTFDFAVMYVPAEGVYAEVLRLSHARRPLFESAMDARVVPMSPLTMYGYLQTILFGLKCLRISKSAEAILDFCGRLDQDIERFATEYEVLGKHLTNARTRYEDGARRLDRFRDRLEHVVDLAEDGELEAGRLAEEDRDDPRPSLEVVGE